MNFKMKFFLLIFKISLLSIIIYNCEMFKSPVSTDDEEIDNNYPTILYPLSSEILQQLQEEFDKLNNNKICSRLNKYGLTGRYHCFRNNPKIKISDENIAINYAVSTLVKNNKFTNVMDIISLTSCGFDVSYISDDRTHWGIIFGHQKYQGYEVYLSKRPYTNIKISVKIEKVEKAAEN